MLCCNVVVDVFAQQRQVMLGEEFLQLHQAFAVDTTILLNNSNVINVMLLQFIDGHIHVDDTNFQCLQQFVDTLCHCRLHGFIKNFHVQCCVVEHIHCGLMFTTSFNDGVGDEVQQHFDNVSGIAPDFHVVIPAKP